jgi:phenylacetic acid degradation operon negative regulatory protein
MSKKAQRIKRRKQIEKATGLIASTSLDLVLLFIHFTAASAGKSPTSKGVFEAHREAFDELKDFDRQTFKKTLYNLKTKGLIQYAHETINRPKITSAGLKRLQNLIPEYDEKRHWDGKIYLITYDIPEKNKPKRDALREQLKTLGCGMLQESVWITPYNPQELLKKIIREEKIQGSVIISDVGKDGSIGNKTLEELVADIYHIDKLNREYWEFLFEFKKQKEGNAAARSQLKLAYLSILKKDPQLPFELLPEYWVGDEAYEAFKSLL